MGTFFQDGTPKQTKTDEPYKKHAYDLACFLSLLSRIKHNNCFLCQTLSQSQPTLGDDDDGDDDPKVSHLSEALFEFTCSGELPLSSAILGIKDEEDSQDPANDADSEGDTGSAPSSSSSTLSSLRSSSASSSRSVDGGEGNDDDDDDSTSSSSVVGAAALAAAYPTAFPRVLPSG